MLLQDANDLFLAETASLHRLSPSSENRLTSNRGLFRGAGQHLRRLEGLVLPLVQHERSGCGRVLHPAQDSHRLLPRGG
ncbi:hypothetical protein E7681_11055 [Thalassobius vesicularis]|uniref:Uncharacterized protein n=1 Tax=Thalassobius vesicularis TaxID=1294297 RepID=A0A4V3UYV9_9RHOB|nr:hypothetical protein E7681_11055 [Thalassobius vesicularis]